MFLKYCVVLLVFCIHLSLNVEVVPESNLQSRFILAGEPTRWRINDTDVSCNYSTSSDPGHSFIHVYRDNEDRLVSFPSPGYYYDHCTIEDTTSLSPSSFQVVTTQHKVALCMNDTSTTTSSCNKHLQINPGEVVYWTTMDLYPLCTGVQLVSDVYCSNSTVLKHYDHQDMGTGHVNEGYQFNNHGVYYLFCLSNSTGECHEHPLLTITVHEISKTPSTTDNKYSELIYSHAAVMFVTFGIILPLGAFLASVKQLIAHVILQICGQIATTLGLILGLVYVQLNHGNLQHFSQLHSIIGLFIIFLVLILQPFLKVISSVKLLKKEGKIWHKRLGIAVVFFGLSNIFIGMLMLSETPLYVKILYGIWVVVVLIVYVVFGGIAAARQQDKDDFGLPNENGDAYWKSKAGRISLSPALSSNSFGPSKLSKEVINEKSFIQIRKKSVDVLETPFSTGARNSSPHSSGRQRKISNVHFGPVVAEQFSPVAPNTPNNTISNSNFGFGEKAKYTDESDDSNDKEEEIDGAVGTEEGLQDNVEQEIQAVEGGDSSDSDTQLPEEEKVCFSNDDDGDIRKSLDSLASLNGSVRITRHSTRAHTKASEIFQRSNSFSRPNHLTPSISISSEAHLLTSPPIERSLSFSPQRPTPLSPPAIRTDNSDSQENQAPVARCPFRRSPMSDSALPLHERRQRRTGLEMQLPKADNLSIGKPDNLSIGRTTPTRNTPARSPSRSPSFSRKKKEMLVDNTLRSVMQMSDDAIISANAQGEIVFWSNGAMKMFGYTPGEAIGSSLQMIMPQRYKEKHQNGVNKRTDFALDYIKKHNTAPEEQKHARLYAVHGVSKSGKEFGVEVVVTSFVIDKEIYYTGIITETDKGLTRQMSASSLNSEAEIKEKQQKALVIGTQMKIAHKLRSAEYMTKSELQNILECSLKASEFEVPKEDLCNMVDGIIQAADTDETGVVRFTELIDLLAKHRLYISDSGVIAKYGKSRAEGNLSTIQQMYGKIASFCVKNLATIFWSCLYMILSFVLLLAGFLTHYKDEEGWGLVANGFGPLLSFNCVLVLLLMSLKGITNSLKGSIFAVQVFPLSHFLQFHVAIFITICVLSVVHVVSHLCSFAFNNRLNTTTSTYENFRDNFHSSISPVITGIIICILMLVSMVSSLPCLRKLCKFIGFYVTHWIAAALFYIVLLIHGYNHFNSSFWKWLLPVVVIFILDRLYLLLVLNRFNVKIGKAFAYDETSRTIMVEIDKPKRFKFLPGQFIQLNIPRIGKFNWQYCQISSSNKEEKLKVFLPHDGNVWLKSTYAHFKANPLNPKPKEGQKETAQPPIQSSISGPFGCGANELFKYQAAVLVCGDNGPHVSRSIIQTFLEYRRSNSCHCGCHPSLMKLYFIWVIPSGNDYEWFTDFLSDIIEDKHIQRYLDIRIYLTNINSPPDELASALIHLALKTGGPALSVKRPSQPQLSKLHANTSYGNPDFESLLDFVSMQQGTSSDKEVDCGVFTIGNICYSMSKSLKKSCEVCSKKRGPSANTEMDAINSPYRRKLSTSDQFSPSPPEQPKEWHINFIHHHLAL